jgi:subtilisin family serine protease
MNTDPSQEPYSDASVGPTAIETTGNYLVVMAEDAVDEGVGVLESRAGLRVQTLEAAEDPVVTAEQLEESDHVLFSTLGVAVVKPEPDQVDALALASHEESSVLSVEPERVVYAIDEIGLEAEIEAAPELTGLSPDYLRGYRDAVDGLLRALGSPAVGGAAAAAALVDESVATWGLQLTKTVASNFNGRGVRVAVLDTGFDLQHPDFAGRSVRSQSFIAGEAVQDRNGHGTHCIGTACGPQRPTRAPRYGVASKAEIFAGKVLSNRGSGVDGGILAGITWAIANRCRIVSMSLGARVPRGATPSPAFETVARRAASFGTIIIAAAGNDSRRATGVTEPVSHPANCPSIMAVAAVDSRLAIASFSNAGLNPNGGQVDIAGPGVRVYSSWPRPTTYNTINGTSMATPHVAGIAALHLQANPTLSPNGLKSALAQSARRLPLSSIDVGAGLVQAP